MKRILISLVCFLTIGGEWFVIAQTTNDLVSRVDKQRQLMMESKSADDIYTVKSRIDKMAEESINSSVEAAKIRDAYLLISDKLAEYSHFKSGCLVYFNYLSWLDRSHQMLKKEIQDSLGSGPSNLVAQEPVMEEVETTVVPNDTVVKDSSDQNAMNATPALQDQNDGKDYTKWMIALAVLVIVFTLVFLGQRKKVSLLQADLANDQKEVRRLFRISSGVSMLSGVIRYAREFSMHCAEVLSDLIEMSGHEKQDSNSDLSSPKEAVDVFKRISTGDSKKS